MNDGKLDREKWFELVVEQEKSGLSVNEFCQQRHLKAYLMYYYRQEMKKTKSEMTKTNVAGRAKLMPVQINASQPHGYTSGEIRLIARNGLQCILSGDASMMRIKQIVEALMSC